MPAPNFQDVVVLASNSLSYVGEAFYVGTGAGAKSVVFQNDVGAIHFNANPTAVRTIALPDAGGTVGLITGISGGTTRFTNGELVFSNANGVSFGVNGSTITASIAAAGAFGGIAAGTQTATTGTVLFSNSNGITFGMSGSSRVTASFDGIRSISAGTTNATGSQVIFSNSNGVSFGANGATITASVAGGGGVALSAGTQSVSTGTVVFSNSNEVTFGMSGSSRITASVNPDIAFVLALVGV